MENETEKIVHFVCASEQVSYLENSNAFFPRLDAIANALQSAADCSVDDKIDFDDFISIAAMVDAEIFVLNDNEFPPYVRGILIDTAETSLKFKCRYIILVRKGEPDCAKMFCIGHEIGHIVCNHSFLSNTKRTRNFKDYRTYLKNEFEANHIAGALLMRKKHFIEMLCFFKNDLVRLADYFGVSYEKIAHRLAVINFSPDIHFIKIIEEDGRLQVAKHLVKSTDCLELSSIHSPCYRMSACKVFDEKEFKKKFLCQYSTIVKKNKNGKDIEVVTLFCLSKLEKKYIQNPDGSTTEKRSSITIGCRVNKKDVKKLFDHYLDKEKDKEILHDIIPVNSCGNQCTVMKKSGECRFSLPHLSLTTSPQN